MNLAGFIFAQSLNALSQAAVLFFIACGLTFIFGIMRIVNFAHGGLFMLGAYVGYSVAVATGSFWLALWQFLERTRAGLLVRAVSQNAEMMQALGTDVQMVRTGVFAFGCAMAALGGVLSAPLVTAFLGMGTNVIIDAFVIVIIGGM